MQQHDMIRAIECHRDALRLDIEKERSPYASFAHLANVLFYQFQDTGDTEDIRESIKILRNLLDLRKTPYHLALLSRSLRYIYK